MSEVSDWAATAAGNAVAFDDIDNRDGVARVQVKQNFRAIMAAVRRMAFGVPQFQVEKYGAIGDGVTDDTAAFNAAVLAAYQSAANVLAPFGEIYSVRVTCAPGRDYKIAGTVLVPGQVIVDGQGCRFIGIDGGAGASAYSPAGQHMFETAYYTGSAVASNALAASETVWRVIGAGVVNATICNTNCGVNAINLQEQSILDGLRFSNVSAPIRMKGCFYTRVGSFVPIMVRNSALATGQPALLLHGAAAHDLDIDIRVSGGAAVGMEVTATNSFSVRLKGSFEEGYAGNSIGLKNNGAYCQSWTFHSYVEGVRKGIVTVNGGAFFACDFSPGYFSGCEYAVQAETSGFRACTFDTVSFPEEGVGLRNLVDFSAPNNDVMIRVPAKGRDSAIGIAGFPSNIMAGSGCQVIGTSYWRDTTDTTPGTNVLAMCDARQAGKASVGAFAWEGAQMVTKANQVPFASISVTGAAVIADTLINFDASNMLCAHFLVTDFVGGPYLFDALIFGSVVYPLAAFSVGKGIAVTNNAGLVRLTITGLDTTTYTVTGGVRHL